MEELDENLRKQWPRKGRLEVEVFQERKSQVTHHNRKYMYQTPAAAKPAKNSKLITELGPILRHAFARR